VIVVPAGITMGGGGGGGGKGAGAGAAGALVDAPLLALLEPEGLEGDAEFDDSGVAAGLLPHPATASSKDSKDSGKNRVTVVVRMKCS
jgi:hypothetical protein